MVFRIQGPRISKSWRHPLYHNGFVHWVFYFCFFFCQITFFLFFHRSHSLSFFRFFLIIASSYSFHFLPLALMPSLLRITLSFHFALRTNWIFVIIFFFLDFFPLASAKSAAYSINYILNIWVLCFSWFKTIDMILVHFHLYSLPRMFCTKCIEYLFYLIHWNSLLVKPCFQWLK